LLNDESVIEAISELNDLDYRLILRYIAENSSATFTLAMILKTGLTEPAKVEKILYSLSQKELIKIETINTGDSEITIYHPFIASIKEKLLPLYIALTYLRRFEEFKLHFYSWCG
jgi:RNA-binding protein YhbY